MAQLLVRNLEDDVKTRLQRRARRHGRSTEEEVREILRNAVKDEGVQRTPLGTRLRQRFAGIGLTDELPECRGEVAQPATFEEQVAEIGVRSLGVGEKCRLPNQPVGDRTVAADRSVKCRRGRADRG